MTYGLNNTCTESYKRGIIVKKVPGKNLEENLILEI
jgi:hypothetical protein